MYNNKIIYGIGAILLSGCLSTDIAYSSDNNVKKSGIEVTTETSEEYFARKPELEKEKYTVMYIDRIVGPFSNCASSLEEMTVNRSSKKGVPLPIAIVSVRDGNKKLYGKSCYAYAIYNK